MTQSMTGFGKGETLFENRKITVEIRSVNGKNSDISLKTQFIPREKEIEVKRMLSSTLNRGSIDLFVTVELSQEFHARNINKEIYKSYFTQIKEIWQELNLSNISDEAILNSILKIPDILESQKRESEFDIWEPLKRCIELALEDIVSFRKVEGAKLEEDIIKRVNTILDLLTKVKMQDGDRITAIKDRLLTRLADLEIRTDHNRFEQEIIYYLEKLDITEECVRLLHHCNYLLETLSLEQYSGKKLGFIAQEMGREINTLGSKANNATIQSIVVEMKDELEKIKEQSLNIL